MGPPGFPSPRSRRGGRGSPREGEFFLWCKRNANLAVAFGDLCMPLVSTWRHTLHLHFGSHSSSLPLTTSWDRLTGKPLLVQLNSRTPFISQTQPLTLISVSLLLPKKHKLLTVAAALRTVVGHTLLEPTRRGTSG